MILGFKNKFTPLIIKGTKIHTIREDKPNRWKEGNKIHFAIGIRTKNYCQFKEGVCKGTQKIDIIHKSNVITVKIDGKLLGEAWKDKEGTIVCYTGLRLERINDTELKASSDYILHDLVANDGFITVQDFFKWFNKDFTGKIIHWTDLKY